MSQSPMSITQLCNSEQEMIHSNTVDMNDPEVRLAAEALDDLANLKTKIPPIMLPPISTMSAPSTTPSSPAVATRSGSIQSARQSFSSDSTFDDDVCTEQPHFMRRVSNHPLVHSALRAYESSKASSPVVKYGAEMVESIASPIYDKFGRQCTATNDSQVNASYITEEDPTIAATTALANASLSDPYYQQEMTHRQNSKHSRDDPLHIKKTTSRSASRSTSPHRPYPLAAKSPTTIHHHHRAPTAVSRSRWRQLAVHAGLAAGTTAAVISEESMKCLKYCLSWLQYATQHIEQQMHLLRNVLVAMATGVSSQSKPSSSTSKTVSATNTTNPAGTLASIKKEVIETLRKVVEVISKYAGAGLPEQAKASVRSFILALPSRWALLNSSTTQSPVTSPALKPHTSPQLEETSVKLLNFGSESVEMLQSVSTVFSDTVDRADLWLDRLHSVGMTRRSTTKRSAHHRHQHHHHPDDTGDISMESEQQQSPAPVNNSATSPLEPMETK